MKILFIYKYEYLEPLGIMYLSSYLKSFGHRTYFIDLKFSKNYIKEVGEIKPDIIAYSVTTGKHKFYRDLNLGLKKKYSFFSVFGGPHCTFFPEFIEEKGVDAICRGESELAFGELVEKLSKGKSIKSIKNIDIKIGGKIHRNKLRPLIQDLDILPNPDRDLLKKYKAYRKLHRRVVITGRGCPYNCTYCFNHIYNKLYLGKGKIVRKRSVEKVINELKEVKKNEKPKRFLFIDDIFIINKKWVLDFCEKYGAEIKLPFICYVRVNLVDEEIIRMLKRAGCITIVYAIESGNDYIRKKILKKEISKEEILKTSRLCRKYNIKTYVQNMVGLPDENLSNVWETIKLNIECKPDYPWVSIFQPYPRTELCDYSIKKGYYDGNIESLEQSYYYKSPMKIQDIKKIERLHHLFPFAVNFPIFIPFFKLMLNLPLNELYIFLWNINRLYSYLYKINWLDFKELFG